MEHRVEVVCRGWREDLATRELCAQCVQAPAIVPALRG